MRRIRVILALLGVVAAVMVLGPNISSASAHICTNPVEINVGERSVINIGVAAEDKPITRVDMTVPKGFDLNDQIGYLGWVGTRVGDVVHFAGSTIKPYTCSFFSFDGTAPKAAVYLATIVTHADDGTTRDYVDPNPYSAFPAMGIYAGVSLPNQGVTPGGGSGGLPKGFWTALAVAMIAGGVVIGFAYTVSRRRAA